MITLDVNGWAILVASFIQMALGAFWYSPALFGKKWMHYMGFTQEHMEKHKRDMWRSYTLVFLGSLLMSFVLFNVVNVAAANDFVQGAQVGFWLWLGFLAPSFAASVLWEGKPPQLYLINIGYYLVGLLLSGGVLGVWM